MKINADLTKCQGYANCVMAAPEHFDLDDRSLVVVLQEHIDPADLVNVEDAVLSCPAKAIWITES
ncbi:ferredoxin [Nocardioides sp.]|uniref:ferredoxin n=1 Tax=Nocardioides sp. TaxID=35761 RepID=UPI002630CA19|nr:ferredoxin [Nocardioides sp.]MDI6909368.1 ferredoxin [Nocardioides sp.]